MASRLQEFTDELIKANRRAYHDHGNLLPSHPVRVKNHPKWFSHVEDLSNEQKIQQTIASDINLRTTMSVLSKHGTPYLVGGSVRDIILGKESKDYDIEVYGISAEKLGQILEAELGAKPQQVGKQFGVFKFGDFDISLPRKEVKVGERHTDFDVEFDENLEPRDGAKRRDFTINALMYNPKTGKIYDFFGGLDDLHNKQLKHIDDKTFVEDALRVYRAAQFAGRFGFTIHPDTKELASSIDLSHLPPERIYEEFKKLFLKSPKPSVGIQALDDMGVLDKYFPEISDLKTTEQRSDYHAEGDVYIHTNMVIDKAAEIIKNFRSEQDKKTIMLAAFAHDFGKPSTTEYSSTGAITQHGHEEAGVEPTKTFLGKLTTETDTIADVSFLVEHHLLPMNSHRNNLSDAGFRKMINKYGIDRLKLLSAVSRADVTGRLHTNEDGTVGEPGTEAIDWFEGKIKEISGSLGTTPEGKITPLITGQDLLGAGFNEGPYLGKVLGAVRSQQEDGSLTNKTEAMKFVEENFVAKSSLAQFKEILKEITPEGVRAMASGLVPQTGNPEAPGKWILPPSMEEPVEEKESVEEPEAETERPIYVRDEDSIRFKAKSYYSRFGKDFITHLLNHEEWGYPASEIADAHLNELILELQANGQDLEPFYEALVEHVDNTPIDYEADWDARDIYAQLSMSIAVYNPELAQRIINDSLHENGVRLPEYDDNERVFQLVKIAPMSLLEEWFGNIDGWGPNSKEAKLKEALKKITPEYNNITGKWSTTTNPTENTDIPQLIGESREALRLIEERFSASKYFTDDIRSNFSEKITNWNSFKEGDKLLPSLEELPENFQNIFQDITTKEDPTVELVKVIAELYRSTQFGLWHEASVGSWEESSTSAFSGILKEAASEVLDVPIVYHPGSTGTRFTYAVDREGIGEAQDKFYTDYHSYDNSFMNNYIGVQKQVTSELLDMAFPNVEEFEVFRGMDNLELVREITQGESKAKVDQDNDFDSHFSNVTDKLEENPISSWSLDYTVSSADFAEQKDYGVVIRKKINKGDVWSSFLTHANNGNDYEMLVIPNKNHFTLGAVFNSSESTPGLDSGHSRVKGLKQSFYSADFAKDEALKKRGLKVSDIFNSESEQGSEYQRFLQELEKETNINKSDANGNKKSKKINIEAKGNADWIKEARKRLEETKTDDNLSKGITPEGIQARARGLVPQTGNPEAPGRWILPSERDKARGSTARPWAKTTVGTWVLDNVDKDTKILDYGAGKGLQTRRLQGIEEYAPGGIHAEHAPDKPFTDVHAYDTSPPYNDASKLDDKYGVVMASNVLNVQESDQDLHETLNELASLIDDDGKVVVNFPDSPRKNTESMPAKGKAQQREWFTNILSEHFNSIESIQANHWELSKPKIEAFEKQDGGGAAYAGGTVMGTEQSISTFGRTDSKKKPKNELFDILSTVTKKSGDTPKLLEVMIGKKSFNLEMTTDQVKGLGGRTSLEPGHGMIFPFRAWYPAKMTMNDMKFPLDFIIVGEDDRIIQIEKNVQPEEDVILTFPPCKMIIELNAGEADNILLNDIVSGVSFFQNYLVKSGGEAPGASKARAGGLVPQTGNWQFPGRWVLPEHADDENGNPVNRFQEHEDRKQKQKQATLNFTDRIQQSIDFDEERDIASSEIKTLTGKIESLMVRKQKLNAMTDGDELDKIEKGLENLRGRKTSLSFIQNQLESFQRDIESKRMSSIEKYEVKFDDKGQLASFAKISDGDNFFHIDSVVTVPSKYRKENSSSGVQVMMDVLNRFLTESFAQEIVCQPLDEHVEAFYKKLGFTEIETDLDLGPLSDDEEDLYQYEQDLMREGELSLSREKAFNVYNRYSQHFKMTPILQKEHIGVDEEIKELIALESRVGALIGGKFEKEQVEYRDATETEKDDGIMCGTCTYFNADLNTCDLVNGTIISSDWCSVFTPIDDSSVLKKQESPGAQQARKEGLVPQSGRWDKPERWVRPEESDDDDQKVKEDREITSKKKFFGKIANSYDPETELQALEDYKNTLPQPSITQSREIKDKIDQEWEGINFIDVEFEDLNNRIEIINNLDNSTPSRSGITEEYISTNIMEQYEFKFGEAGELEAFAKVTETQGSEEDKYFSIDTIVTMPSKYKKQGSSAGTKLMMDLMNRFLTESDAGTVITIPLNSHVAKYYKKFGFTPFIKDGRPLLDILSLDRETAKKSYNNFAKRFKMDLVKQEQVDHDDLLDNLKELIALEEEVGVLSGTMKKKEEKIEKSEEWSDYHLKDVAKQMLAPDHRLSYESINLYPQKTGYKSEADFIRELSEAGKFDPKLLTEEPSEEQDMNLKDELDTIYKQEQETVTTSGCSFCEGDCDCVMVTDLGCKCDHDCICSDLKFGKMVIRGGY